AAAAADADADDDAAAAAARSAVAPPAPDGEKGGRVNRRSRDQWSQVNLCLFWCFSSLFLFVLVDVFSVVGVDDSNELGLACPRMASASLRIVGMILSGDRLRCFGKAKAEEQLVHASFDFVLSTHLLVSETIFFPLSVADVGSTVAKIRTRCHRSHGAASLLSAYMESACEQV
ncbi:unnamed protein product, partial [Scytosiphon promiscuus]